MNERMMKIQSRETNYATLLVVDMINDTQIGKRRYCQ